MRERPPEQTLADESLPPTLESEWGLSHAGVGEGESCALTKRERVARES